jgi:hypothetical protein
MPSDSPRTELDLYCRNCSHMTRAIGVGVCLWCKSPNIGVQPELLGPTRAMGPITDPSDKEPTKHQRFKEGFALLRMAGDL